MKKQRKNEAQKSVILNEQIKCHETIGVMNKKR